MLLYHGSDKIIDNPQYGIGRLDNDYGSGFYTTQDPLKSNEWAVSMGNKDKAYTNIYDLNMDNLNILKLDDYGTLVWIAEIVYNRGIKTPSLMDEAELLVDEYKIDTSGADIIIGQRAGGSYMNVIDAFLSNQITLDETTKQLMKGDLGQQVFIKSKRAFEQLKFINGKPIIYNEKLLEPERRARLEMIQFVQKRIEQLQNGYRPQGLMANDIIGQPYHYHYDKEYANYYPVKLNNIDINDGRN